MFEFLLSFLLAASVILYQQPPLSVPLTVTAASCPVGQPHVDFGGGQAVINESAFIRLCGEDSTLRSGIYRPCAIRPSVVYDPNGVRFGGVQVTLTNCNDVLVKKGSGQKWTGKS